jgi:hypothetical protein
MSVRTKALLPPVGVNAQNNNAPSAPPHELSSQRAMSVDDFRRLVEEIYLAPETLDRTLFQDGAAVYNTAILVDTSGSMEHDDPQLAKLKDALTQFAARLVAYAAQGIRLNVCLIGFSEKITAFFAVDNFTEFAARPDDPFYKAIHELRACGGTNYQAAFHKAGAWLAGHAGEQASSAIFFITDGRPTCYFHDAFTHSIAPSTSGVYIYNGTEFAYGGKGRMYYDANGNAVSSNSGVRRYRSAEDGRFEVRIGSSLNWSGVMAVFAPDSPARRVRCTLPEYYVPGQAHYFDASGSGLSESRGAAYRVSASGNFEQYRRGAWHEPAGAVIATALDGGGIAHPSLTTKVQGGSGVTSGVLEAGKSLQACRTIKERTQRLSVYAIGIGGAVEPAMLNAFDTTEHAKILFDTGQLAAALTVLAHGDFSAVLPELAAQVPPEPFHVHGYDAESDAVPDGAPHHHAAPGEAGEHAASFQSDNSLLSALGNDLLGDDSELLLDAAFSPTPAEQAPVAVVRHFCLGADHLDLPDLVGLGADATLDHLLSRITASQANRIVNGEIVGDLVLHIHAGDGAMSPVVQTIVFEGFMQANPEAPSDLQSLLHNLLHT